MAGAQTLCVEEFVWDACLNLYEAFSLAERQDFDELGILSFFEFFDVTEFADADFDLCAFIGFVELVAAKLCPKTKTLSVFFYVFPIFNQID